MKKDCLDGLYSRRSVVGFMKDLSEWMVVCPTKTSVPYTASVSLYRGGEGKYYADFLESLDASKSRIAQVLPSDCDYVLTLPVSNPKQFRESFRRHLDCRAKLSAFESECSAMKKKYGPDPERWALDYSFREVALARWDGHVVVLLRPAKKPSPTGIVENRLPGYPALVFGGAFGLEDDSCLAVSGRWIVIGSEEDVDSFISCPEDSRGLELPDGKSRFIVYDRKDGVTGVLSEKRGSVKLNVY